MTAAAAALSFRTGMKRYRTSNAAQQAACAGALVDPTVPLAAGGDREAARGGGWSEDDRTCGRCGVMQPHHGATRCPSMRTDAVRLPRSSVKRSWREALQRRYDPLSAEGRRRALREHPRDSHRSSAGSCCNGYSGVPSFLLPSHASAAVGQSRGCDLRCAPLSLPRPLCLTPH